MNLPNEKAPLMGEPKWRRTILYFQYIYRGHGECVGLLGKVKHTDALSVSVGVLCERAWRMQNWEVKTGWCAQGVEGRSASLYTTGETKCLAVNETDSSDRRHIHQFSGVVIVSPTPITHARKTHARQRQRTTRRSRPQRRLSHRFSVGCTATPLASILCTAASSSSMYSWA